MHVGISLGSKAVPETYKPPNIIHRTAQRVAHIFPQIFAILKFLILKKKIATHLIIFKRLQFRVLAGVIQEYFYLVL